MPRRAQESQNSYRYMGKVLVVGDSGVGKSSLMLRYCRNQFSFSDHTTFGVDYCSKSIPVEKKEVKVQIWDTAGQEIFRSIIAGYFQNAHGIVLTYAVNDLKSFHSLPMWMEEIKQKAPADVAIILVGAKADIGKAEKVPRCVSFSEGKALADKHGIKFFEVSSKDNVNVNEVFYEVAKKIKHLLEKREKEREKKDEEEWNTLRRTTRLYPQPEKKGCFEAFLGLFKKKKTEEKVSLYVHVKGSVSEALSRISCESIRTN